MDDFDSETSKRNPVFCALVNAPLDLDRDDLGHPAHPGLWERLIGDRRPVDQRGLHCPDCRAARGARAWMYVFERQGLRIAAHHNPHRRPSGGSDVREAYRERYVRAAESAGHTAEVGAVDPTGRRRTDVLVTGAGGQRYGFEPQVSYLSAASARSRDAAARADGITAVWHTVDPRSPLIDAVHWTRTDDLPAAAVRAERDLLVRGGVRALTLELCDRMPTPCPVRRQGSCGRRHARWGPRPRQFDDLVRDIAAGRCVPLTVRAARGVHRFWSSAEDREAFLDSGGTLTPADESDADVDADADAVDRGPAAHRSTAFGPRSHSRRDTRCAVDRADRADRAVRRQRQFATLKVRDSGEAIWFPEPTAAPARILRPELAPVRREACSAGRGAACGRGARLYPGGWFCAEHRPGAVRV
ncbi:hypothetical protein SAMN05216371_7624 [Streptomyces sp. TLI_053]|uniref:hypothetical protein n=1 Tax=Streptomyces sp. TLI_053 TaxID=1855352 RepID=UPI000879C7D1|nr:hypothetical protein [Streptomyces sp. TLI_053]SDT82819.1 hypothetical protein SAMN05216371_7624 [Streptomyces sp. TLI_053]